MTLLDDLAAPPVAAQRGPRCGVSLLYETLEGDVLAAVSREIEANRLNTKELSRRLKANGILVSNYVIGRHRKRECLCR